MKNITYKTNGGILLNIEGLDVEILSHNFHNPHCNIVCAYFDNGENIIELTYYNHLDNTLEGHEYYSFSHGEVGHIYSRNFGTNVPKKYQQICEKLKEIYSLIDFEQYKERL